MSEKQDRQGSSLSRASYGLNAPGVVRNLLVVTAACFLAWALGIALEIVFWSQSAEPFRLVFPLHFMGPWIGLGCLVMAALGLVIPRESRRL